MNAALSRTTLLMHKRQRLRRQNQRIVTWKKGWASLDAGSIGSTCLRFQIFLLGCPTRGGNWRCDRSDKRPRTSTLHTSKSLAFSKSGVFSANSPENKRTYAKKVVPTRKTKQIIWMYVHYRGSAKKQELHMYSEGNRQSYHIVRAPIDRWASPK